MGLEGRVARLQYINTLTNTCSSSDNKIEWNWDHFENKWVIQNWMLKMKPKKIWPFLNVQYRTFSCLWREQTSFMLWEKILCKWWVLPEKVNRWFLSHLLCEEKTRQSIQLRTLLGRKKKKTKSLLICSRVFELLESNWDRDSCDLELECQIY